MKKLTQTYELLSESLPFKLQSKLVHKKVTKTFQILFMLFAELN